MPMPKGEGVADKIRLCTPQAKTVTPEREIVVKKDWCDREWDTAQDPNNLAKYVAKKDE